MTNPPTSTYNNVCRVIKLTHSCRKRDSDIYEHFAKISKTNGDSRKEVIAKNGGTMPEDLPTPKKSIKQIEKGTIKKNKRRERIFVKSI